MKYPSRSPPPAGRRADGCRTRSSGVQLQVPILEVEAVVEHDPIELSPLDPGRKVAEPVRMGPLLQAEQGASTKTLREPIEANLPRPRDGLHLTAAHQAHLARPEASSSAGGGRERMALPRLVAEALTEVHLPISDSAMTAILGSGGSARLGLLIPTL